MLDATSQCKNLATLMKMKPKRILLGHNTLSDAPCWNSGMVLNEQGPGRHPRDAIWTRCQVSKDRVIASLVARHIGVRVWCKMSKGLHTYLGGCEG